MTVLTDLKQSGCWLVYFLKNVFVSFRDILKQGGSAVDSAIAALICTTVIHPQSMGLGGGVIFTIYNASTGRYQPLMQFETLLMPTNKCHCHYFNVIKIEDNS